MNRVKRAIILAAGQGTRLKPLTNTTPKPLVIVNGKRIIDTIIEGLFENNINEIYIVVGYKKELFYRLKEKYPSIELINNPYYKKSNNISSLYCARDYLEDCFILDADQLIINKKVLNPKFNKSGYSCALIDEYVNEWFLNIENGMIKDCEKDKINKGWRLYSISRWNKTDGKKLKDFIEIEHNKKPNIYWDEIPLFLYKDYFELEPYIIDKKDVVEIDTIKELSIINDCYKKYL